MNLIFLYGPPAAGKATVAAALGKRTGYKIIDNHRVIDYVGELFPFTERQFDEVRGKLGRQLRLDVYTAAASAGVDLVTTCAPLGDGAHDFIRATQRVVAAHGGRTLLVQLPTLDVLLERVTGASRRGRKIDTVERWHEVVDAHPLAFETFPGAPHLVIDNSHLSAEEVAVHIMKHYQL